MTDAKKITATMDDDVKFWRAVERADQAFRGNSDRKEWLDRVVQAGAARIDAEQMFADAHYDHVETKA